MVARAHGRLDGVGLVTSGSARPLYPGYPPLPEVDVPLITPCLSGLPTADLPLEALQLILS